MATLKVFDGSAWQVVAGQGSPGQGVPAGGAAGALLAKNSAANLDTAWTTGTVVENNGTRVAINGPPVSSGPALRASPPAASAAALDLWQAPAQNHQILRVINSAGTNVPWYIDRYGYPKQFVQGTSTVGTTDGNGDLYISFPEPFLSTPVVVASGGTVGIYTAVGAINTASFQVRVFNLSGGAWANALHRVNWMAFETRT